MGRKQKQVAISSSLPAPTGGWNVRDSIANMDKSDAVILINFFPRTTDVQFRYGYSLHATDIPGQVETLIAYNGAATETLFAISNGEVYNATSGGSVGAADLSGLSNSRWQYINISTTGGNFIEMCNGADAVHTFNGTTWTDQSAAITGAAASSTFIGINLHKNRVWFTQVGTLTPYYLPTQSITGLAVAFDLRAYCPHGGFLMAIDTWTIDAGYGVDDLAVFVTSQGDVAVFRGTDPATASTWALVGVWYIGAPIGRRCMMKYAGDLLIITEDGLQSMSAALQSSRTNPKSSLTDKIRDQMSIAVQLYGDNYGWETVLFPPENMLLMNVPVETGGIQQQYVMNTITGAWAPFEGWDANTFTLFSGNQLYFGGNTFVGRAWNTNADNGTAIEGKALQAFSTISKEGQVKEFTMMRPTFFVNAVASIQGNINVDFDLSLPTSPLSVSPIEGGTWDSAIWDTSNWAADLSLSRSWQGATGSGYYGAPFISIRSVPSFTGSLWDAGIWDIALWSTTLDLAEGLRLNWLSTEVVMRPGAII